MTSTIFTKLADEFPRDVISWRAQSLTKDGDKAMALAYLTARDVMERLDDVLGPENWSDRYEFSGSKTICYLSLFVDTTNATGEVTKQWITKADGAGDSDIEAEKGAISDAFKRAAVKWQIGRYLYEMPAPWVPCESYNSNGKNHWKKWTADPWDFVKAAPKKPASSFSVELATSAAQGHWTVIAEALTVCTTLKQLNGEWSRHQPVSDLLPQHFQDELKQHYLERRGTIEQLAKIDPKASLDAQFGDEPLPKATRVAMTP